MSMEDETVHSVILGAGLVGTVAALCLSRAGLKVVVVEANAMEQPPFAFDGRTTAISYGSAQILKDTGLWDSLKNYLSPINKIKVFEAHTPFSLTFDQQELSRRDDPMGYMIDNMLLRQILQQALLDNSGIVVKKGVTVQHFSKDPRCITLTLSDNTLLKSMLVIAAEGRHSPSRRHFGIRVNCREYGHTALVGILTHANPHEETAFEVFHSSGPLAFLPMPSTPRQSEKGGNESLDRISGKDSDPYQWEHRSAIVWSSKETLQDMTQDELLKNIYHLFPYLGPISFASKLMFYPLSYQKTSSLVGYRYALVGDAAHVMHPVAGQGVNLGWRDAKVLCDKVIKAYTLGLDVGSDTLLAEYHREREKDQKPLLYVTHSLIRLFGIKSHTLQMLRSYGLGLVDRMTPLKRFLMHKAMGI